MLIAFFDESGNDNQSSVFAMAGLLMSHEQLQHLRITPIFDGCQEFVGQAQQDYAKRNEDGKLGRMFVSNTHEYVQLQAADFLAWEYRVAAQRWVDGADDFLGPVLKTLEATRSRA